MHTLPHENTDYGYSLRIGKNLPDNAANLAYVHTDSPEPKKNLAVINHAQDIPENREKEPEINRGLYSVGLTEEDFEFDGQVNLKNLFPEERVSLFEYKNLMDRTIPLIENHVYYISREYEVGKGEWNRESGQIILNSTKEIVIEYMQPSAYFTYEGVTNLTEKVEFVGNFVPNRYQEQEAFFNNIVIVDLTEAYGIGNEPSHEFMDHLIQTKPFFDKLSFTVEDSLGEQPSIYTDILMENEFPFIVSNQNVLLTNQFTYDKNQHALYYIHSLSREVNIGNQEVYLYINGKRLGPKMTYNRLEPGQFFVFESSQIRITRNNYKEINYNDYYKIIGVPTHKQGIARLYLITNFENNEEDTYTVEYNAFESGKLNHTQETINAQPLFLEDLGAPSNNLFMRSYKLIPVNHNKTSQIKTYNNQGYYIQLKAEGQIETSEINAFNRLPYEFEYQIEAEVKTRFSNRNPIEINIGYIYINETVFGALPLTSAMKKLVSEGMFPEYVTFKNPHHAAGSPYPESTDYWEAYLEMPEEHYLDYDVLVIAGYGDKDVTHYNKNIQSFLSAGGLLLIDNNHTEESLNFLSTDGRQTFFADIGFSRTSTVSDKLQFAQVNFNDRYYNHPGLDRTGMYHARIDFHNQENTDNWINIIETEERQPTLTYLNHNGGKLLLSNLGLMTQIMLGHEQPHKILVNLLLHFLEHRTFKTPIFKEQVLHKDDLLSEDYNDHYGNPLYYNDVSDQDGTQLVAKKIIGGRTADLVNKYLPIAYQRPISSHYQVKLKDNVLVTMENGNFEKYSEERVFEDNSAQALPGWRYIVQSKGDKSEGGLSSTIYHTGTQAAYIDYNQTKGFFEKEFFNVQPGNYRLTGFVRTDSVDGGGFSIYNADLDLIASNETLTGTSNWKTHTLNFSIPEETTLYIRLGSSEKTISGQIYFDDLSLYSEGNIRMTPANNGELELYAYAIEARGQNYLLGYMNNSDFNVVRSDIEINPTIRIRSFVYEWNPETMQYQKHYGKNSYVKTSLRFIDGEKVVANLIDVVPTNEAGFQWNYAQNIFYQIEVDPSDPAYPYVNVSVYDPRINQYFYSSNGQWIVNREDLWSTNIESTIQLRAESLVDNLKVTGSQYTLIKLNNSQIKLVEPNTNEEQDRWYPRIKNGAFSRELLSQTDIEDLTQLEMQDYPEEYIVGRHQYALPEYHQQSFYPRKGERLIENELAQYINPHLIRLQKYPIVIKEQYMETVLYNFDGDKKTFRSLDTFWDTRYEVQVYQDEQLMTEGYDINFEEGFIKFEREVPDTAKVFASYRQNNVRLFRRRLANNRIEQERLTRVDDNTMKLARENIATYPSPVFYRDGSPVNPNEYWIDFEEGLIHFYQNNRKNIYASYLYYIYEELTHTDINGIKGEISIKEELHFQDEIVATYIYKEDFLEYKGYYDEENNIFMHLDLNPTAGHTFTASQYNDDNSFSHYYEESSEKLLNRTVYFYLLPQYSRYLDNHTEETSTVRHCFGEKEWLYIKSMQPAAILLGTIHVRENTNMNNIVMLDARKEGGGLKETIPNETIYKRLGYTSALWDIGGFDGLSYYKNAVTVIQIPNHILKVNGGMFTEEDVRNVIDRYLALGVYPIIEYVTHDLGTRNENLYPEETSISPDELTVIIEDLKVVQAGALDVSQSLYTRKDSTDNGDI